MNSNSAYRSMQPNIVAVPMQGPSRPAPGLRNSTGNDVNSNPRFLYHYTSEKNFYEILEDQVIFESDESNLGIRHGRGVYLTTLSPKHSTESLLKNNFGNATITRQKNEEKLKYVFKFEVGSMRHFQKVRGEGWDDRDIWVCREDILLCEGKLNFRGSERDNFFDESKCKATNEGGYVDRHGTKRKWRPTNQTLRMLEELRAGRSQGKVRRSSLDSTNDEGYNSTHNSPGVNFDAPPEPHVADLVRNESMAHINNSDSLRTRLAMNRNSSEMAQDPPIEAMRPGPHVADEYNNYSDMGVNRVLQSTDSVQIILTFNAEVSQTSQGAYDVHNRNDLCPLQQGMSPNTMPRFPTHHPDANQGYRGANIPTWSRGRDNLRTLHQGGRIQKSQGNLHGGPRQLRRALLETPSNLLDHQNYGRQQPQQERIPRDRHLLEDERARNYSGENHSSPHWEENAGSQNRTHNYQPVSSGPPAFYNAGNPLGLHDFSNGSIVPQAISQLQYHYHGPPLENRFEQQRAGVPNPCHPPPPPDDCYGSDFSNSGPYQPAAEGHSFNRDQPAFSRGDRRGGRERGSRGQARGKRGAFRPPR